MRDFHTADKSSAQLVFGSEVRIRTKMSRIPNTAHNYAFVLCLVFEGPPRFECGYSCFRSG